MRGGKQPPSQELIWHNQPGLGVLLLNINDFTEHQYQKSPLCDHDDGSRKKNRLLVLISEHRKNHDYCPDHKNDQESPYPD